MAIKGPSKNKCPLCDSGRSEKLIELDCGNFDSSAIYQTAKIISCSKCGHVYNLTSKADLKSLSQYYNEEYALSNLGATYKINPYVFVRYSQLYKLISPYIKRNYKILDAGCGKGDFLDYLYKKGFKNLFGVDISRKYVSYMKEKGYSASVGAVENIPFKNKSFDFIVMDQILEHLADPRSAFKEAARVLNDEGLLCVSVPDASKYGKKYFFDFYWFILREHLQHFDMAHLRYLAEKEGFELTASKRYDTLMSSEKAILPALSLIFRKSKKIYKTPILKTPFKLKSETKKYIKSDLNKLNKKIKIISRLATLKKPLYVWGMGREFLFLYESAGLKKCNIAGLIDRNHYKQKALSVDNTKISDKSILKKSGSDSILLITALGHSRQIKKEVSKMDYQGKIVNL